LLDNGQPLEEGVEAILAAGVDSDDVPTVSMSPHRLCRYSNNNHDKEKEGDDSSSTTKEIFGAHTDSTFITAVPVAAVAGLDVYDEAAARWYRPELRARRHWRAQGGDPDAKTETVNDATTVPWHARYVALLPGELLQLATRTEVLAAVHRVVAAADAPRLSAPILFRGRPHLRWDCDRYLGGSQDSELLRECDGMNVNEIHDAMQQKR